MDQDVSSKEFKFLDSNEKFKFLTELLPIAVYSTDQDGLITYYNEQAAKLWGRRPKLNDPNELKFCGSWKMFDTNGYQLKHSECPMARALQDGEPKRNEEIIVIRPDFSKATVLVHIDPLYNDNHELKGAINVLFDVTDRKQIERDTFHLASIVESSDDAIISKTLSGDITSWNKAAEKIFGYKQEEVLGKHITILIPPDKINEEDIIIAKIKKGERVDHYETIRMKKNGKRFHVSLTISPIKNSKGEIIGASKIARDISEKVATEKRLKRYNEELRKLNRYKDEFISLASHELKTPLTVVKAHMELLSYNARNEDIENIEKTRLHIDKLIHLINKMFDVTKINGNEVKLDINSFKLDDLIKECIDSISAINSGYKVIYHNDKPEAFISADYERIEQVLINLLTNAIKYSPEKDTIHLSVIHHENEVEVQVKDQGMGIPSDKKDKIFDRFYRLEGVGKHIAGLGIGLYISQQIIQKHKGTIRVINSEPGKGSTFSFTLPKKPLAPEPKNKTNKLPA